MRNKFILLFAFFCIINLLHAQKNNFNDRYVEVSVSLIATDIREAFRVSDSLVSVAKTDEERAKAYMLSANIHQNIGEKAVAIRQATFADEIAKSSLNPMWQASTAGFLATAFRQVGLLEAAERYIDQAERANNKAPKQPMYTLTKINILHERALQGAALCDYEKAEDAVRKAGKLIVFDGKEDKRARLIKATNHQLLALCYIYLENFRKAEELYHSSLAQIGDDESNLKPYIFRGLAEVALGQDSLDKAYTNLKMAEPYLEASGYEELKLNAYRTFSKYYWKIGDIERGKKFDDLFIELRNNEVREAGKVLDELFEEMYHVKENYKNKLRSAMITVFSLTLVTIFLTLYIFFLRGTKDVDRTRATNSKKEIDANDKVSDKDINNTAVRDINMSKETEKRLLKDIDKYEKNLYFLDKNISLSSMAKELNTNERYVSYIIRKHRGKDFYSYIQACRIQFIINRIKMDSSLLDYKLAHLAEMSGFTNLSKFSIAFKDETGLPPSAFVHFTRKELGKGGRTER